MAGRRDEALETLANESVHHVAAWLLETAEGPILAYAIEAEDLTRVDHASSHRRSRSTTSIAKSWTKF